MEDVLKFIEDKYKQGYNIDLVMSEGETKLKYLGNTIYIQVTEKIYNNAIMKLAQLRRQRREQEKAYDAETYEVLKMVGDKRRISDTINRAEGKDTREMMDDIKRKERSKKNIKNKPRRMTKERFVVKTKEKFEKLKAIIKEIGSKALFALLLAGVSLAAIFSNVIGDPTIGEEPQNEPDTAIETTYDNEHQEGTFSYNPIDTIAEVEDDFVDKYLEAYNEKYGTNYQTGDMIVTPLRDNAVYELSDGRKVTRGSKPYETEKVLNNIGKFDIAKINSEVVQVISNGRTLGTYNMYTGEFIYSGNQIEDLTDEEFEEPTLESLGINKDKLTKAGQAIRSRGVEGKDSERIRAKNYAEEGFEIGD